MFDSGALGRVLLACSAVAETLPSLQPQLAGAPCEATTLQGTPATLVLLLRQDSSIDSRRWTGCRGWGVLMCCVRVCVLQQTAADHCILHTCCMLWEGRRLLLVTTCEFGRRQDYYY